MKMSKYILTCLLFWFSCIGFISAQNADKDQSAHTVTGTIVSVETNKPLAGVSVTLQGVRSVMTDDSGKYSITIPSTEVILHVSVPGYAIKEVSVRGRAEINLALYGDEFKTNFAPIATPEGKSSPLRSPNAWTSINHDNILSTSTTADVLLQGKVSGLNTVFRSGAPGGGANMYLRGLNTMNAGSQPLYVVDGMLYENSSYSSSLIGNYYANPLASIDIKDIESVTVMKDGTSLYGTKGANGVIIIETLRPGQVETKINFHAHTGVNFKPQSLPMLNASDHKALLSEVLQSSGMSNDKIQKLPYFDSNKPVAKPWGYEGNADYYRYNNSTDWQKDLYATGNNLDLYLNVAGGDDVGVYALSVGYFDQKGILNSTDFERFNTRFNSEIRLTQKLKIISNMSFVYGSKNLFDEGPYSDTNPIFASLTKSPFMTTNFFDSEGKMSPIFENVDIFGQTNPYSLIDKSMLKNSYYRFVGNIGLDYNVNQKVSFSGQVGVNFNKEREKIFFPTNKVAFDTLSIATVKNRASHRVDRLFTLYSEAYGTYKTNFDHNRAFKARLGLRYQNNKAEDDWGKAYNTASDNFKSIQFGDPLLRQVGGAISNWNWLSLYGTVDYSHNDKYFANLTMAADASSRYGRDVSTFLLYPSIAGAWLITGENFMKNTHLFDVLKLRTSYTISGNDDIGNYSGMQYYVPQNIMGTYGLVRGNIVDLKLKPEKNAQFNVGIDAMLLNERLTLSVDWYTKKISDMITRSSVSPVSGFSYYLSNAGSMRNTGFDVTIGARIIDQRIKWDMGLTISTYKNKVLSLNGDEFITDICNGHILTREGQPVGMFYGYKTDGVYATQDQADAADLGIMDGLTRLPFQAGDVRFIDNGDKLIDDKDRTIIGNPNPDFFGSITNTLKYKNWTLDALMTYSVGNDIYNYTRAQLESMSGYYNQTQAVKNRWRVDGDITNMPRASFGDPMGNARFSDRWIEDGSYIRLKNVTLSYGIPLKNQYVRKCIVFATAENLVKLTKYKGADPEFSLGQNTLYYGIDATFTPQPQSLSIGIKLEL